MQKKQIGRVYKKLHRWPGLILSFILLYYGITGIFMNHRGFFSPLDVNRNILPKQFRYSNWNNSALKGNLIVSPDSILVYGNIGVWATDSVFSEYTSLNDGFPVGSDNRKVFDLHLMPDKSLYAATQFGLYAFDRQTRKWQNLNLEVDIKRFVGIESIGDTLYVLNRSFLFTGFSNGVHTEFKKTELQPPPGYKNEVSLFKTIWQIHSGEIFGLPGKLFVDFLGIVTIFLSITGIIYFFFPYWIRKRIKRRKQANTIIGINRWSLKWHNEIGAWTFVLLVLVYFTGIFLRPPVLIAIARSTVKPLKFSHLDQLNPWYDKLRDILYDPDRGYFLLSTSGGMFHLEPGSDLPMPFKVQPPVSVMGINTFEKFNNGAYLIGSFSGLFIWHPDYQRVVNYATGKLYRGSAGGRPVGDFKVTGTITGIEGKKYMIDYEKGAIPLWHTRNLPQMPQNVLRESQMSLWNFSLEMHTGRLFQGMLGDFYILIVPLGGLAAVVVVISGYLLYRKRYRNKKEASKIS